jgi:TolB-like protein/Tfp pilus assembly protein PilF
MYAFSQSGLLNQQALRDARSAAHRAIELDASLASSHLALAHAALAESRWDEGLREARIAAGIGPSQPEALRALGVAYLANGDARRAIDLFERGLRLDPNPPDAHWCVMGAAYRLDGQIEEAVQLWERGRSVDPKNLSCRVHLAHYFETRGPQSEAQAVVEELRRADPALSVARLRPFVNRAGTFAWTHSLDPDDRDRPERIIESLRRAGLPDEPHVPAAERPSLIVLPFDNFSGDPEQQYFADGLTEDLTTELSGTPNLKVMSRNLAFLYKDEPVSPVALHEELGVDYVIEGSVRRSADRIRINVQLIDGPGGAHVWAQKYDRDRVEIFEVQSEIIETVLGRLNIEIRNDQQRRLSRKPTDSLTAYEAYLKGRELMVQYTPESTQQAREYLQRAIELDPDYADAHAILGGVEVNLWSLLRDRKEERLERAEAAVTRALEIDPYSAAANAWLAGIRQVQGRFEEGLLAAKEAVRLEPTDTWFHMLWTLQVSVGDWDGVQQSIDAALDLNPRYVGGGDVWTCQGLIHYTAGRFEEALALWERARRANASNPDPRLWLAYEYGRQGRIEDAQGPVRELLSTMPDLTAEGAEGMWYWLRYRPAPQQEILAAFRSAGLP